MLRPKNPDGRTADESCRNNVPLNLPGTFTPRSPDSLLITNVVLLAAGMLVPPVHLPCRRPSNNEPRFLISLRWKAQRFSPEPPELTAEPPHPHHLSRFLLSASICLSVDQLSQTELRMRIKKAPRLNGTTSFSFDMLDTSVLDAGIHRRQAQGPLVAACSNNGWLEPIGGHLYCNCQDHWSGRYCHEECNRHGELQGDGATCTCDENWSSNSRFPARWGSTQCNMVTCQFFGNFRPTLPGDWYGAMNINGSCGLAPRQVGPTAPATFVPTLRPPVVCVFWRSNADSTCAFRTNSGVSICEA